MTRSILLAFNITLLFPFFAGAQVSQKLPATNIIGTAVSINYDTNNQSTTVNTIANAFDGDLNTFFASYVRTGGWVGLDLGLKHIITKVAYCPRKTLPGRLLLGVIEGANNPDFGDAIVLCLITQTPPENKLTEQTINCSRGFRYVRYVGPNDVNCNIAELEFYGYSGSGNNSKLYQTTNLPDVIIHTKNAAEINSKTVYVKGIVSIISENGTQIHTDSLDIRGRGNASWNFPKKPYRMKLYSKANVLGFPSKEKSWTLINNYGDKTLMRNMLAYDLSKRFEMPYTPAGKPVNVYLNGEFKGCYQLCDQVEVATNRVDIAKINPADITQPNISGGYCLKLDAYYNTEDLWFVSPRNVPVSFKNPKVDEIAPEQLNYIKTHFNLMETTVYSTNYKDPVNGYRKYLDTETFVKYFLINEIVGNTDIFWQVYIYKNRNDDKFYFGPVWDFDLGYDNDKLAYPVNNLTDWLYITKGRTAGNTRNMVSRLFTDEELVKQVKTTYAYYRNRKIITEEELLKVVDYYANELDASQKLNFTRWNILNSIVHENPRTYGSYAAEVENVRRYIRERIAWMDKKTGYVPTDVTVSFNDKVFVWSYADKINIRGIATSTLVEIFDISGSKLFSKTIQSDTSLPFRKGMYIVRLSNKEGDIKVVKCWLE